MNTRIFRTLLALLLLLCTMACVEADDDTPQSGSDEPPALEDGPGKKPAPTLKDGTSDPTQNPDPSSPSSKLPSKLPSKTPPGTPTGSAAPDKGDIQLQWEQTETFAAFEEFFQEVGWLSDYANIINQNLSLPYDLAVIHKECGILNAYYNPADRTVSMCYEFFLHIYEVFSTETALADEEALVAAVHAWSSVFFHELAHALIDAYDLPITGKEEDAADDFSTVFLIQMGHGVSAYYGAIFWHLSDTGSYTSEQAAGEHSLNSQRFYNIMCTIYGSDPEEFSSIPEQFPEMEQRLPRCAREYEQKVKSWDEILEPWFKGE